ncbi:MAG: hypothetical protein ABSA67_10220 [Candidatus Brocadiia bacterium]|jgi:biotin operon repressor
MTEPNIDPRAAVLEYLTRWKHLGPHTKGDIAQVTGLSTREVEEAIHELRHSGEPIVAGDKGYLWTEDPLKLDECLAALKHRAGEIHGTISDLEATRDRLLRSRAIEPGGQARLFAEAKA